MLLLTKQWERGDGRKGEGARAEEAKEAFVILGLALAKAGGDRRNRDAAIQRGQDPYSGQMPEAKKKNGPRE